MASTNPLTYKAFQLNETIVATQIKANTSAQERQPIHLITLIDTSTSMSHDDKLKNVVTSLTCLLEHMTSTDYLSVITYDTDVKTYFKQKKMDLEGKTETSHILSTLIPNGMTNMSGGILQGTEALFHDPAIKECILLLTDGFANKGVTEPSELVDIIKTSVQKHPSLSYSTIGYGTDHNAQLLTSLATEGGGSYNVVNSLEDTAIVFGDVLGGLLSCVGQNITVIYPSETEFYTAYAVHDNKVFIGDIQAEGEIYILTNKYSVNIGGYYLPGGIQFNDVIPMIEATDSDKKSAIIAYLRYKVVEIIKITSTRYILSVEEKDTIKDKITSLKAEIALQSESPIWSLLVKQLDDCYELLDNQDFSPANITILSQHSACIGTGRGMMSGDMDPVESPFGNALQRNISSGMRSVVQRQTASGYPVNN